MKYYLYSKSEIVVEIDNNTHKMSFSTPLVANLGTIVKVFSLENSTIPFCFEVGKTNSSVKEINFENYTILEIQPKRILSGEFFKSKALKNGLASVVGKPYKFNILLNEEQFSQTTNENLNNIEIKETKNYVVCSAVANDSDFAIIFHKTSKKFLTLSGDITLTETSIKAIENKNTLARHGELSEYEISDKNIKCLSKEPIYLNKMPTITPPFLSHIAFFEAVKLGDYNLAKTYLTPEFAGNLTPTHFKNFFDEFDEIKPLKENEEIKIALLKKQSENVFSAKVFALEFDSGKIANILED